MRLSRPTRARGLKHDIVANKLIEDAVAPHAGAWIETISRSLSPQTPTVAPHAGAWIETPERVVSCTLN